LTIFFYILIMRKMFYETTVVGALETNCYLVYCGETRECAIVDPGAEPERIFNLIAVHDLKPIAILNTHGHVDHVGANRDMKEKFDVPLYLHASDLVLLENILQSELSFILGARESPRPDKFLEDKEKIKIGKSFLYVIHTPGHSQGSVSFLSDSFLLSGDTLFCGGVGRTDFPGGSWLDLEKSIKKRILTLPDETLVLPGHGPHTTVGEERVSNPFLR